METTYGALAAQVLAITDEAGALLLEMFRRELTSYTKDAAMVSSNFATSADLQAEELILERLRELRPNDVFIAEESSDAQRLSPSPYPAGTLIWYIDPLDGTTNFSRGLEHFCISIAAVDARTNATVLGVVAAPALGRTWSAHDGAAYVQDRGAEAVSLKQVAHEKARVLNIGFAYEPAEQQAMAGMLPQLLLRYPDIRAIGSAALHLCFLAEGRIDAEFQLSVRTWDYMAGKFIAECAGAHVIAPYNPRTGTFCIIGARTPEYLSWLRQLDSQHI